MSDEWNKIIFTGKDYWIIKQGNTQEYVVMKKPQNLFDNGHPIAHFFTKSKEEAIDKGVELAKEHGLDSKHLSQPPDK